MSTTSPASMPTSAVHAGGNSVATHAALGTAAVTGVRPTSGPWVEVDGHLALGNGVGVDAHTGLDLAR